MTPRATYRVQFQKEFGFDEAAALARYLARLGIMEGEAGLGDRFGPWSVRWTLTAQGHLVGD